MTFHRGKCRFNKQSRCNVQHCIKGRHNATSNGTSAYMMSSSRNKRLCLSRTICKWNTIFLPRVSRVYMYVYIEQDLKLVAQ